MKEIFEKIIEKLESYKNENMIDQGSMVQLRCRSVGHCREKNCFQCVFERAIEIVKQVAAEYNNGWIPCSERLPETNESVLCWAKSTARGGDVCFVGSCHNGFWFLQSSADTHSFPGQYVIVAWKPIEPYQPKGE